MVANKSDGNASPTFESLVLLLTVFVVGLCTIVYELLIGSVSSYFLGDSIKQFSITIGLTMTAMGIGTLLSRTIRKNLMHWFILVELALGLIGGLSVPFLFVAYSWTDLYYPVMISLITVIGILIGLEIPLLTRIMERHYSLRANISNVLSLDYFGAFAATLLFPFLLLPFLGIFRSSLVTGSINLLIGVFNLWYFRTYLGLSKKWGLKYCTAGAAALLIGLFLGSQTLMNAWENAVYEDRVILSRQSSYQKIVLTKNRADVRLYLDGHLQFSTIDEYRYHEALVHVPLSLVKTRERILILGGGDGLAAREVLKYAGVKYVTIVDLDPDITDLARSNPMIVKANMNSLGDGRVIVKNMDAFKFLEEAIEYYDVILADLPDPRDTSLARLYSREFFRLAAKRLSRQGVFVTQSTSPFFAKKAFWCIKETIGSANFKQVVPYHVYVPSFGDWGFVMAANIKRDLSRLSVSVPTRYLDDENLKAMFLFSKDLRTDGVKVSSLNEPNVLSYYLEGWKHWN
ncbi:MAG: polyamine aminopropyltransferase [Candidatus Binatia bacterium]